VIIAWALLSCCTALLFAFDISSDFEWLAFFLLQANLCLLFVLLPQLLVCFFLGPSNLISLAVIASSP
jgi:hypothetical protein